LGDFILCLTAVEGLAQANPALRFTFRTRPQHARLVSNKSYYGDCAAGEGSDLAPFFRAAGWETAPLPPDLSRADAVLVFGQIQSIPFAHNLSRRLPCPVHWIQSFPPDGTKGPVSCFISKQLRACGWETQEVSLRLDPLAEAVSRMEVVLSGKGVAREDSFLVLHAGSGGRKKIWPFAGWRMLLTQRVREWPVKLVTVLGPADDPVRDFVHEMEEEAGLRVIEGLDLPLLAALLARASAYLGHDSGVTHLAAAMGTQTLALFGPTSPEIWAPVGENVRVMRLDWSESGEFDPCSRRVDPSDAERIRLELFGMLA
jgi:ADP-heptose:LPS heptosyltransferase